MNSKKIVWAIIRVVATNARLLVGKFVHGRRLKFAPATCLAFSDTVSLSRAAYVDFGKGMRTRGYCSFNVQEQGALVFGDGVFLNRGCMFNCRSAISVGNGCEFGPNVLVYDHDHYFEGGRLKESKFKHGDVRIGSNCWIGANSIILRGTILGEGCVVGAGSVLKGEYPAGALIIQKRETDVRHV